MCGNPTITYDIPTVDDFKGYFVRDFPYADPDIQDLNYVIDADINTALNDTSMAINPDFAWDQNSFTNLYLLMAAHFLVMNLRASSQGINGQFSWLQGSRGVGSVSESIAIPARILEYPLFSSLTKTSYGHKFLYMILPQLVGQVFSVAGKTQP